MQPFKILWNKIVVSNLALNVMILWMCINLLRFFHLLICAAYLYGLSKYDIMQTVRFFLTSMYFNVFLM